MLLSLLSPGEHGAISTKPADARAADARARMPLHYILVGNQALSDATDMLTVTEI
jgi:hypothetical protein